MRLHAEQFKYAGSDRIARARKIQLHIISHDYHSLDEEAPKPDDHTLTVNKTARLVTEKVKYSMT